MAKKKRAKKAANRGGWKGGQVTKVTELKRNTANMDHHDCGGIVERFWVEDGAIKGSAGCENGLIAPVNRPEDVKAIIGFLAAAIGQKVSYSPIDE